MVRLRKSKGTGMAGASSQLGLLRFAEETSTGLKLSPESVVIFSIIFGVAFAAVQLI